MKLIPWENFWDWCLVIKDIPILGNMNSIRQYETLFAWHLLNVNYCTIMLHIFQIRWYSRTVQHHKFKWHLLISIIVIVKHISDMIRNIIILRIELNVIYYNLIVKQPNQCFFSADLKELFGSKSFIPTSAIVKLLKRDVVSVERKGSEGQSA